MRTGRVVVGVDGSLAGMQALRWAVGEARRRRSELYAVRAWACPVTWQAVDCERWRTELGAEAAHEIRAVFRDALGTVPADVTVSALAVEGPPAEVLTGFAADEDDVLVVGGTARRWGGVARACLRRAACPVIVVPAPALARTGRSRALARQLCRETEEFVYARRPGSSGAGAKGGGRG